MYLAMTQEEYEQVPREAIETVANRIGIASDSYDPDLFSKIEKIDPLAAGLLDRYTHIYANWWLLANSITQGGPKEDLVDLQRLIIRRGSIRAALMTYLNSEYPTKQL